MFILRIIIQISYCYDLDLFGFYRNHPRIACDHHRSSLRAAKIFHVGPEASESFSTGSARGEGHLLTTSSRRRPRLSRRKETVHYWVLFQLFRAPRSTHRSLSFSMISKMFFSPNVIRSFLFFLRLRSPVLLSFTGPKIRLNIFYPSANMFVCFGQFPRVAMFQTCILLLPVVGNTFLLIVNLVH